MPEAPEYVVARVEAALAEDARVNELGLHVAVRGTRVFVTGSVATEGRRAAVTAVAGDVAAGYEVHNETVVAGLARPADADGGEDGEVLS